MTRIAFDAKRLFCNSTGLGNYSRSLVANLSDFYPENEYSLYTPRINKSNQSSRLLNNPSYSTYKSSHIFKSYWRSVSIVKQLKKDKIEIYHGLSNELPIRGNLLPIKSLLTIHDLIFKTLPDTYSFVNRKIYDYKSRTSCQRANKIIAISQNTKNDIVNFYGTNPAKIKVIYQACDPLFYKSPAPSFVESIRKKYRLPQNFLLYVGSIQARKNILGLIEAYARLNSEDQIPLVLIGRGRGYKNKVMARITELGVTDKIIWLNDLNDNTHLQCIYIASTILIYPSLYEGFGLPVAEALLCKTPVITSRISSLPEAGGPSSVYVDPCNIEEMSHAISKVLTDSILRDQMIKNGLSYAKETFSPQKLTQQLMDCYLELLA